MSLIRGARNGLKGLASRDNFVQVFLRVFASPLRLCVPSASLRPALPVTLTFSDMSYRKFFRGCAGFWHSSYRQ